jgi:predicted HicB family RNase H-like nuclease
MGPSGVGVEDIERSCRAAPQNVRFSDLYRLCLEHFENPGEVIPVLTQPSHDVTHYRYTVFWSREDHEFVGTVAEFPSLSFLDPDQTTALRGIEELVTRVVQEMKASGEEVPAPLSEREYSGNIRLRVTPQKHCELATRAQEQGVSLNRYLNSLLP